jgi:enoyl-CoA hydratase/carnithine racemase
MGTQTPGRGGPSAVKTRDPRIVAELDGTVLRLVMDRPDKLNALDPAMSDALFAAVEDAMASPDVRVVVISGRGRAFSSGADLKANSALQSQVDGLGSEQSIRSAPSDMVHNRARVANWLKLRNAPKPLIAQVHGYCLGIANEIAGCCDLVVCGESARFGMPEARDFALPPTLGFWPLRIGLAATKELLWTGRLVTGQQAAELGLAEVVVPDEELAARTAELAERIAEVPAARLAVVKQAVNAWGEAFGVNEAASRGAEYHALYHQVSTFAERFGKP